VADSVEAAIAELLSALGVDLNDENFSETPRRLASYLREHFLEDGEEEEQVSKFAAATFPSEYKGMVIVDDIEAHGMCPHHLLPVRYMISVAYLPTKRVVGLSKLPRIAEVIARQALLQETITTRIADTISKLLATSHVAVVVTGIHSCMAVRGVRRPTPVTTSAVRGDFLHDSTTKAEYLSLRGRP
jgi:GTP cyclohydrolase I